MKLFVFVFLALVPLVSQGQSGSSGGSMSSIPVSVPGPDGEPDTFVAVVVCNDDGTSSAYSMRESGGRWYQKSAGTFDNPRKAMRAAKRAVRDQLKTFEKGHRARAKEVRKAARDAARKAKRSKGVWAGPRRKW